MKTTRLSRTQCVLVFTPILVAVLLIFGYNAIAKARRAGVKPTNSIAVVSPRPKPVDLAYPTDDDDDPALIQKRREFLDRFYGNGAGKVSPAAFADAQAAARAVPPSPLGNGRGFGSGGSETPATPLPWTFPVPPPIANDWGGGGSARVDVIAVSPINGDIVYVGSEGGLSKSTDGGEHWSYLSGSLESQSIRSIAIDPVAPNIVYAGTGTQEYFGVGIYRSTDSGATWSLISGPSASSPFKGSTVGRIAIDPATAGSTTTATLYASVTKTYNTPANGQGNHSLWRSTDSGQHWTNVRSVSGASKYGGGFYDIAIDPAAPATVYIAAPDGVYKRSGWGKGTSWTMIQPAPPNGAAPSCLAFALPSVQMDTPGRELYWAFESLSGTSIVKSSDSAHLIWGPVGSSPGGLYCFGVDPVHANRIFVGGVGDLRYSLNAGVSWLASGGVHVDMHAIAFCVTNIERNYLGSDGGIYRADYQYTPTMSWANKNQYLAGALLQGVSISRDDHMVTGSQDNGTQLHPGDAPPWNMIKGGDGWKPLIHAQDSEIYYFADFTYYLPIAGDHPNPWRVNHGVGTNVTPLEAYGERPWIFPAMHIAFGTPPGHTDRVIMGFQNVWRSVNSGDNWTRIGGTPCPGPSPSGICGIDPVGSSISAIYEAPAPNTNFIYAIAGDGHKVLVTENAYAPGSQATWADPIPGLPTDGVGALAVHPTEPRTVYATNGVSVYKTVNWNAWANIAGSGQYSLPANGIYRDVVIDPANPQHVIVCSHVGVFATVDGGLTWGAMNYGLPKGMPITSLSFNRYSRQLAASTYGRGVYVYDLDDVPPTVSITSPLDGATVGGTVTIWALAFDNHRLASVQFKVDGVILDSEVIDVPAPNFSIDWNTKGWPTGEHTLTAEARDTSGNLGTSVPVEVRVVRND